MSRLRSHFPFFNAGNPGEHWVYLDSAATSHKPDSVISAITRYYEVDNANVHRGSYGLARATTENFELARKRVAEFINAPGSENIVWTRGATEAINLVASCLAELPELPGSRILVAASEHHANLVPWQRLADRRGMSIDVIPLDKNGRLDSESGLALLTQDTALLAIAQVSNALGNIHPLAPLMDKAAAVNAITLIDGAQSLAHIDVDVSALNCDFFVFSGHKAYGPTGIGVLYSKSHWLNIFPPYLLGGEMVESVSYERSTYQSAPLKFEAGTPNIAGAIGLASALTFIDSHRDEIRTQETKLYRRLMSRLKRIEGIVLYGDQDTSIATQSFTIEGVDNQDLGVLLNERNIALRVGHHCAMPLMESMGIPGTLRVSLSCYNNEEDIDRFIEALEASVVLLQREDAMPRGQATSAICPEPQKALPLAESVRSAKGWDEIYRHIMLAGKHLNRLPVTEQTKMNEVFGCESQVFVKVEFIDDKLHLQGESPSKIVRGLMALVFEPLVGLSRADVANFEVKPYLTELGLARHLSESRGNGLSAVVKRIQSRV